MKMGPNVICAESNEELDASVNERKMNMGGLSFLRVMIREPEIPLFIMALLLTGFAHNSPSNMQRIQVFHAQDTRLWLDHSNDTVPTWWLFAFFYIIITPLIYVGEVLTLPPCARRKRKLLGVRLAAGMWVSTMLSTLLVELGKGYVGRLRPSFASKCLGGQRPYTEKMILNDQECTEKGTELTDSRRSFPSGHASLAVGGAAYAQLCAVRASRKGLGSWVFIAGWIVMGGGFWVAASRVVDGAHHVGDIAVGALMGIWAALVQFFWVVGRNNVAIQEAQIEVQVERDE